MVELGHTPHISLVVPFYNEGEAIDRFFASVISMLEAIDGIRFEIVCVNDGSEDDTLDRLISFGLRDQRVRVIDLTRNVGKEAALQAGLDEAKGDAIIPIAADRQDWPSLIPTMIGHWRKEAQVAVARRYGALALKAITRFGAEPFRSWAYVGLTIAAFIVLYGGFIVGRTIIYGYQAPSYPSVISVMLLIGGIGLIGIAVVGEYIGRIDDESSEQALYLVRRRYQARSKTATCPSPQALP